MSDVSERVYEAIETAKVSGKVRKGTNEVTKAIERGDAKLVAYAKDTSPKEIIMHLTVLCKEKGVPCFEVSSKEELGAAAGLEVPTASVVVLQEGDAKNLIKDLAKSE